MRPGYVAAALIAVGALMAGTLPASAQTIPEDLEFDYTMSAPLIGNIKGSAGTICHQSLGESFTMEMVAGPAQGLIQAINTRGNEILCTTTIERVLSSVARRPPRRWPRSRTSTVRPASARAVAQAMPLMPPPITATSAIVVVPSPEGSGRSRR